MTDERGGAAEARLPRPPGVLRRAMAAHPTAVDVWIVVWYVIGCVIGSSLDAISVAAPIGNMDPTSWFGVPSYLAWPWWPIAVVRVAVVATALFLRRRYPLAGLVVVTLAQFVDHGIQGLATSVVLFFMIYAVPVFRSVAAGWIGYGIAVVGSIAATLASALTEGRAGELPPAAVLAAGTDPTFDLAETILLSAMTAVWYLAILLLGINLGNRRRYLEAVIDRANQLARERDQLARLAVAEERSRIAREMHDIVSHSVSVMIALSEGAARTASVAPEAAADAMSRSAETGRTALAEMRRMLGALNDQSGEAVELAPQPGVEDLPKLVAGFREAGLTVELEVHGEASGDRGQDLAVYRIVQEALTNALRYAGQGSQAVVTIGRHPDRTEVEVRDSGPPAGSDAPRSGLGSGQGIAGLRERVRMFDGELQAGSDAGGQGWILRAALPVSGDASGSASGSGA
ncbi:sensor histidine kinase [Leucobacter sp. GX24907]